MSRHRRKRCRRRRLAQAKRDALAASKLFDTLDLLHSTYREERVLVNLKGGPLDGQQRCVLEKNTVCPVLQFYDLATATRDSVRVATYAKKLWRDPKNGAEWFTWEYQA